MNTEYQKICIECRSRFVPKAYTQQTCSIICRLLQNVELSETGCWEWTGARTKNNDGYGIFSWAGSQYTAHRASHEAFNGPVPKGHVVRHSCDNPPCFNPAHLSSGTRQDNADDMVVRERQARGEHHPKSKLKDSDIIAIRGSGLSAVGLARQYNVSEVTISHIKRRVTWKHLP